MLSDMAQVIAEQPAFATAGAALVIAIVELYRRVMKNTSTIFENLKKCEDRHLVRDKETLELAQKLSRLEGEHEGIKNLALQVLTAVSSNQNKYITNRPSQKNEHLNTNPHLFI
jgi:hypothetical protein